MQTCLYCKHALDDNDQPDRCQIRNFKIVPNYKQAYHEMAMNCSKYEFIGRHLTWKGCWCKPTMSYISSATGAEVWIHNDLGENDS